MKDWNKFVKDSLIQVSSEKNIFVDGYMQTNYYNDKLDVIIGRSKIRNNKYTYDVNQYEYDETGRCLSIIRYSDGTAIFLSKFYYENSLLKRIENYVVDYDTADEELVSYELDRPTTFSMKKERYRKKWYVWHQER